MIVYLDTSALVKLYVAEEDGRELVRRVVEESERVATSTVAYAEVRAGLARRQREEIFTAEDLRRAVSDLDEDWPAYDRLNVSDSVSYLAGELAERHACGATTPCIWQAPSGFRRGSGICGFSPSTVASTMPLGMPTWWCTETSPGPDPGRTVDPLAFGCAGWRRIGERG